MNLTFVTAFIDLKEDRSSYRTIEKSFELFKSIAESNLNITCFLSKSFIDKTKTWGENIKIIPIDFEELDTYKTVKNILSKEKKIILPKYRNEIKDTLNFMILMNSKFEFMQRAIQLETFKSNYCWLDFNICHVFKDKLNSINYLVNLNKKINIEKNTVYFPGCWSQGTNTNTLYDQINWRFCGGFFIGDVEGILNFYNLFKKHFPFILFNRNITWETNIWVYLELINKQELSSEENFFKGVCSEYINIKWFSADHDDSIIKVV